MGRECPNCGSRETGVNKTPMGPGQLAKNPYFCYSCSSKFSDSDHQ